MTVENEDFNKTIYWVMQELTEEVIANQNENEEIVFDLVEKNSSPSKTSQERALKFLENCGAVNKRPFFAKGIASALNDVLKMQGTNPIGYFVEILQPKFNEVFKEFSIHKPETKTQNKNTFHLQFYKNRADFKMNEDLVIEFRTLEKPLIIKILNDKKGKEVTSEGIKLTLQRLLKKDLQKMKLSRVIDALRKSIKAKFKIDPKIIIPEGVSKSGYRIGDIEILITESK